MAGLRLLVTLCILALSCQRTKDPRPAGDDSRDRDPAQPAATAEPSDPAPPAERPTCEPLPFDGRGVIHEASGATLLPGDQLIVVADSGHKGAYSLVDLNGTVVGPKGTPPPRLPLGDGASDDVEGLQWTRDRLFGITSSGWIRRWRREGDQFHLEDGPYPIGEGDLTCSRGTAFNCGPNYEGLCARAERGPGDCDGYAVSNAAGNLRCLRWDKDGRLRAVPDAVVRLAMPGQLSGCSLSADGQLFVGANSFGANLVVRVDNWHTPANAHSAVIGSLWAGFAEAIVADGAGAFYRFSDDARDPPRHRKYRCSR